MLVLISNICRLTPGLPALVSGSHACLIMLIMHAGIASYKLKLLNLAITRQLSNYNYNYSRDYYQHYIIIIMVIDVWVGLSMVTSAST